MEAKYSIQGRMEQDEVLRSVLKYYSSYATNSAVVGNTPKFAETKNGFKGLGISLNSIFLLRSIKALQSNNYSLDLNHLYLDLKDESNWLGTKSLEDYFFDKTDIFDKGLSLEDGIIIGLEKKWLDTVPDTPFNLDETKLYKNKIIAGTVNEFFSIMFNLFGYDMHMTLSEILTHKGVGAGTTTQVCEQYLGALIAGHYCETKQYRLRKTKISDHLDIGHILIKKVELKPKLTESLDHLGFVFRRTLNPVNSLNSIINELVDSFNRVPNREQYTSPAHIFDINETLIYADMVKGEKRILLVDRLNQDTKETDITEFVRSI